MKRILALVIVLVLSMTLLAGCGKFTCDNCGEEKSGEKHEAEYQGEEAVFCDDCWEEVEGILKAAEEMGMDIDY